MSRWSLALWLMWIAIALIFVFGMLGCALGPNSPTDGPEIVFSHATTAEVELGLALWEEQKKCTGYDGSRTRGYEVRVYDGILINGDGSQAAGLTYPDHINVVRRYYENALSHEYIHHCMDRLWLGYDAGHEHPLWAKCDWRNRGGEPVGMIQ